MTDYKYRPALIQQLKEVRNAAGPMKDLWIHQLVSLVSRNLCYDLTLVAPERYAEVRLWVADLCEEALGEIPEIQRDREIMDQRAQRVK